MRTKGTGQLNWLGTPAWEKLPPSSLQTLSDATLESLAALPFDWPYAEYLSVGGCLGNNKNYALETPTDGYDYITVVGALAAPFVRGTVTISSVDAVNLPVIDPR